MYNDVYTERELDVPGDICGQCDERIEEDLTCGCGIVTEEPAPTGVSCIYTPNAVCSEYRVYPEKLVCDDARCPCPTCSATVDQSVGYGLTLIGRRF